MRILTTAILVTHLIILSACAPGNRSSSLVGPTEATGGRSGTFSTTSAPNSSYDATGSWHLVANLVSGSFGRSSFEADVDLVQDINGNITFGGTQNVTPTFTFTPVGGGGPVIAFRLSVADPQSVPCPAALAGAAQLNVNANAISGRVSGTAENCSNVTFSVGLTRN